MLVASEVSRVPRVFCHMAETEAVAAETRYLQHTAAMCDGLGREATAALLPHIDRSRLSPTLSAWDHVLDTQLLVLFFVTG